jgi:hypothetical protein
MTTQTLIAAILAHHEQWAAAAMAEDREGYARNEVGPVTVEVVRAGTAVEVTEDLPDIGATNKFRVTVERKGS